MELDRKQELDNFNQCMEELNLSLNDNQVNQFLQYYKLLIEWNKAMNLTSITDFQEVILKHFVDSLSIVKVLSPSKEKIMDLGTGAGFPGIPLKIAFPDLSVVLLDSLNKRVNFLTEVINTLKLDHITALHGRAEDYGRSSDYRETFDICVSRAVANLSTLSEYCLPYVKKGGYFIPYKAGNMNEELKLSAHALGLMGGRVEEVQEFLLPGSDIGRTLILIKKTSITPIKYPRSAGKPAKEPL